MQLQINDDFRVITDPYNFILQQRYFIKSGEREGEEEWKVIGYFPTLEHALERLLDKWLRDTTAKFDSIYELIKFLEDAKAEICDAIQKWGELQNA